MVTMVSNKKNGSLVSVRHSAGMAAVHQKAGAQVKEVIKMYLQYSKKVFSGIQRENFLLNGQKITGA